MDISTRNAAASTSPGVRRLQARRYWLGSCTGWPRCQDRPGSPLCGQAPNATALVGASVSFGGHGWAEGPFDNDTAADWCGYLHEADPAERAAIVRATLVTAATNEAYLDHDDAAPAIAAAAILASGMPGGAPITSPYAPDFVLAGEPLDLDDDLPQLAVQALDRILGVDSEWQALWGEGGATEFPEIDRLRAVLSAAPEVPGQTATPGA
jgi:hypothetical protein